MNAYLKALAARAATTPDPGAVRVPPSVLALGPLLREPPARRQAADVERVEEPAPEPRVPTRAVRPRLAALMDAAPEHGEQPVPAPHPVTARRLAVVPTPPADPPPAVPPHPPAPPRRESVVPPDVPGQPVFARRSAPPDRTPQSAPALPADARPLPNTAVATRPPTVANERRPPELRPPRRDTPRPAPVRAARGAESQPPASVEVMIDRVDVRLTTAAPRPAQPREHAAAPRLSLADYLDRRNRS